MRKKSKEQDCLKLYQEGLEPPEIAKILGISSSSVSWHLRKYPEIYIPNRKQPHIRLEQDVLNLFNKELCGREIGRQLGINQKTVVSILNRNGLKLPIWRDIKYEVDENIFEKIDTHEKAWVLGWFYSDGTNLQKEGKIRIGVAEEDMEVMDKIKKVFKYNGPISIFKDKRSNCQNMYILQISRRKISDELAQLGCMSNKTFKIKFPTEDIVPGEFLQSFLLGVWEGDGYIHKNKSGGIVTGITCTDHFAEGLQEYLQQFKINTTIYYDVNNVNKNISCIRTRSKTGAKRFLKLMYAKCPYYLLRKRKKFFSLLRNGYLDPKRLTSMNYSKEGLY